MLPANPAPDHPLFALPHQYQRDRLWSLFGPALLDCSWSPAQPVWLPTDPDWALLQRINRLPPPDYRSQRLGLMFEQLWQQYFNLVSNRVTANRQLIRDGQTLGEIDILTDLSGEQWHLELALKFYLSIQDDWIGPNSRDHLFRKIRHTREHQLRLPGQAAIQSTLTDEGWHSLQSQAIMRGCLFYPANGTNQSHMPDDLNPHHWRGWWCYAAEADSLSADGCWTLLAKSQWISPARASTGVSRNELLTYAAMHFRYLSYPLCAVRLADGPYGLVEQERWLIMPDHWPEEGTHHRLRAKP